jgi:hypothetical protein
MPKTKPVANEDVTALTTVIEALATLPKEQQQWVMQTAASRFALAVSPAALPLPIVPSPVAPTSPTAENLGQTVKAFIKAKSPKNDMQRVACLAYYLTHHKGISTFKSKDIDEQHEAAGGVNFKLAQAVANATNVSKYFAASGQGKKRLTTLGEDVVEALPDSEKVKGLEKAGRPKPRVKRKRGART